MNTIKRQVTEEFHYAMDGRNPVRQPVGSTAEIKAEDEDRLVAEGKIAPAGTVTGTMTVTFEDRKALASMGRRARK